MTSEPCSVCTEETAIGSDRYSSRLVADKPDGTRLFLCSECASRASPERQHELTRAELARLQESSFYFGVWVSSGH